MQKFLSLLRNYFLKYVTADRTIIPQITHRFGLISAVHFLAILRYLHVIEVSHHNFLKFFRRRKIKHFALK